MSGHKLDQAIFSPAILQLRANPVESARYLPAIVGVLVTVESLKNEGPLIRAEMDGFSRFGHEWVCCLWWIDPVRF